jgi:prefoldin subunit 5
MGLFASSCNKSIDNSAADIQALKASVTALQKRSDSLAAALAVTNGNIGTLGKSVDSIRVQLTGISYQIGLLTTQLTTVNANVTAINAQISELNQKYIELLAKLNAIVAQFTNTTAYLNARIDSLSASIVRMQKTSDSLKNALATTNNNLSIYSRSVDTIKIQLVFIVTQINQFTIQLTTINANIPLINAQITLLNQQYADLLAKLNAILAQLNYTPPSINNGLVAYYPFSGNAGDSSGNGNHGTVNGAVLTSDRFGNIGKAYSFDETLNSTITGSCTNYPSGNSPMSISFWYYAQNLGATKTHQILGYGGNNCGQSFLMNFENIDIGADRLGKYEVQGHCLAFRQYTNIPTPANNQWHHIVVTFNGSELNFFNNGNLVYKTTTPITMNTFVNGKIFSFGRGPIPAGTSVYVDPSYLGFTGKLDDIRIYNRAITQTEVTYLATH